MKIVSIVISIILILFGVLFTWGAFGTNFDSGSLIIGLVMLAAGIIVLTIGTRKKEEIKAPVYKVDLPGDVHVSKLTCEHCGGALDAKDISMVNGAPTVKCPYCGSTYQITEEPKW